MSHLDGLLGGVLIPTFVVIPADDRHHFTEALVDQLISGDGACERIFVLDNSKHGAPEPPIPEVVNIPAASATVAEMWNGGMVLAEAVARHMGCDEWNVAILNNDIDVEPLFLSKLASALRCADELGLVYPNHHPGLPLAAGEVMPTMGDGPTRRSLAGWAFMLKGELGVRVDERFSFYFTDDDVELQVRNLGKLVAAVGDVKCDHLEPNKQFATRPDLQAQAQEQWPIFAEKWAHVLHD